MSYSLTPILHSRPDKNGLHKIQIRIIYRRQKSYAKTELKVRPDQFENGQIVNHSSAARMNAMIRKQIEEAESRLLDAIASKTSPVHIKKVMAATHSELTFFEFVDADTKRLKGKRSPNSIRHLNSLANRIEKFFPGLTFEQINTTFLETIEQTLRNEGLADNTLHSRMKRVKTWLLKAAREGLIKKEAFEYYQPPRYRQNIPLYVTEKEMTAIAKLLPAVGAESKKQAGYYFLLSCYTGYRISDCKAFDYTTAVHGNKIALRTKKNGEVVSIPIHSRLKAVLKYVKKNPFTLPEQKARDYVKELARMAGINKHVKFHAARHSFAMMLMANGFTVDEVAELIGDSVLIAKVYARIHNESLDRKVRERLG